jgi:hypothetical protein
MLMGHLRCGASCVTRVVGNPAAAGRVSGDHFDGRSVVYRKGELSKGKIDREWPHQVALPAQRCIGQNYVTIHLFCEGLGPQQAGCSTLQAGQERRSDRHDLGLRKGMFGFSFGQ